MPASGYRRITQELPRRGLPVNHQRVRRVRREDHRRGLRKRSWIRTTEAQPQWPTSPHVLPEFAVEGLAPLWVADSTSVRLPQACVDRAVRLDAYRRRGLGGAVERSLEAERALAALRRAFARRPVRPGLVHHSERGAHSASHMDTDVLKAHGVRVSMSRRGNPSDKAQAESLITTLPYEEVSLCP
jgi:transposase InsO family protein